MLIVFCPLPGGPLIHAVSVSFIATGVTNDEIPGTGETCAPGIIELSQM